MFPNRTSPKGCVASMLWVKDKANVECEGLQAVHNMLWIEGETNYKRQK